MYCWYAVTVKEEVLDQLNILASRAEACARALNPSHPSRKSTSAGRKGWGATGRDYQVTITAQKRRGELHSELLCRVRKCAYVAIVNVGATHRPWRNRNKYKRSRNNNKSGNTEEAIAYHVERERRKISPYRKGPPYSNDASLLTGVIYRRGANYGTEYERRQRLDLSSGDPFAPALIVSEQTQRRG